MTLADGKKRVGLTLELEVYNAIKAHAGKLAPDSTAAKLYFDLGYKLISAGFNEEVLEGDNTACAIERLVGISAMNKASLKAIDKVLARTVNESKKVTPLRGEKR